MGRKKSAKKGSTNDDQTEGVVETVSAEAGAELWREMQKMGFAPDGVEASQSCGSPYVSSWCTRAEAFIVN